MAGLAHDLLTDGGGYDGRIPYPVDGVVTNCTDDAGLGRIKARWGAMKAEEESDWLRPIWPGYMEGVPAVDEPVVIWFLNGDTAAGVYAWFPKSTTKERATEMMLFGTTFCGLYNDLATKFNELKSKFNDAVGELNQLRDDFDDHQHDVKYSTTVIPSGGGTADPQIGTGSLSGQSEKPTASTADGVEDGDADVGKAKDANGSEVSAIADSKIVLSAIGKIK